MSANSYSVIAVGALCIAAAAPAQVTVVRQPLPAATGQSSPYVLNREPLVPSRFVKLPIGSIEPRGWLRNMLVAETKGMTGRLAEISQWLKWEGNAWANPTGDHSGWEELPYWLKGYGDLGYVLKDQTIVAEARRWIDAVLGSQEADGWFGPRGLKTSLDGHADLWPHMVMLNILQSFYEATGDERVIPFMTRYFEWQVSEPEGPGFVAGYWPKMRVGDNIESVLWLYNRTGERWLLDLADKLHRHSAPWADGVANWHGVNITQGFREPVMMWQANGSYRLLAAAERNYQEFMGIYGQTAGGGFATDENAREGYIDPRQGFETCSIVEGMHSYQMLTRMTGDPVWADRTEELAFNTLPAALTPDQTGLRYFTAANQPQADQNNHAPGIQNHGTMFSYSPGAVYRCCQHNVSHGWPYYAEELWVGSADGGLCASLYAESAVTAKVNGGQVVTIEERTQYPFEERVRFEVTTAQPVSFPLYLRIPRWCLGATLAINGEPVEVQLDPSSYARIDREWRNGDRVEIGLPMKLAVRRWAAQKGAVSVDRGPLTYSLAIGHDWRRYGGTDEWPDYEVLPSTPWNYGLVLDEADPTAGLSAAYRDAPLANNPFTPETAPISIQARGRRLPEWQLDEHGLCAVLQPSPALSTAPIESLRLIPMGAARVRIAVFPTVSPTGTPWTAPRRPPVSASHTHASDSVGAVVDGLEPKLSNDQSIPRHTFWPHLGTAEWIEHALAGRQTISSTAVYWFDDEPSGGHCRVPASWRVLYRDGETWRPVVARDAYGVAKDTYNTVHFESVTTDALRLEVQLQPDFSAGVLEWRID